MDIPRHAHVLVLDGRKSLLLKNEGEAGAPRLLVVSHRQHAGAATHDQGTDRPGQTQSSVGAVRSGYEQTDFHQRDEDRFVAETAERLRRAVLSGEIGALVVVAAPRALGVLRRHYAGELGARVVGEVSKDLSGHTAADVAEAIARH